MTTLDFPSLSAMHRAACAKLGPLPALRFKQDGLWRYLTWNDYRRQADEVAAGLIELGVKPGDRIAILSENRWEWLVTDHAILSTGAIDVPIHSPSTAAQIQYQLEHSGACGVVVSSAAQWEKIASVKSQLPDLRFAIFFDRCEVQSEGLKLCSLDAVRQSGFRAGAVGRQEISARESALKPDSIATVIYTSGTTSRPKGVMLSQGNLVSNSLAGAEAYGFDCTRVWLNWLPFSHVFARLVDHYSTTRMGVSMALAQSAMTAMDDVREVQPTYFTSVPRLLEKAWRIWFRFCQKLDPPKQRKCLDSVWFTSLQEVPRFPHMSPPICGKQVSSCWKDMG